MNCACHKMIEAVVQHGCMEIGLSALKACSELAFVAGITRIILTKDTSDMRDQSFCSF